jgi:hypothetical protein
MVLSHALLLLLLLQENRIHNRAKVSGQTY